MFLVGSQSYTGGGLLAQATSLIHELAHVQATNYGGAIGFQNDFGKEGAGINNDKLVDANCGKLIRGLK